jgi:Asp-tRNA(Asn)/Glu-tRNA(Gln) amidotransferase A subunit family amidase
MPIGIQLVGDYFDEATMCRAGILLEEAFGGALIAEPQLTTEPP